MLVFPVFFYGKCWLLNTKKLLLFPLNVLFQLLEFLNLLLLFA
jgi:hypothetical protein